MVNYKNGKIYKIVSDQTEKVYIGSTTQPLYKRFYSHKERYERYLVNKHHYVTSFDIIQFNDAKAILLEHYPCETKEELEAREYEIMKQHDNNKVNKIHPTRTRQEYNELNKEKIAYQKKISNAKLYEANKDIMLAKKKQYYETNKEIISQKNKEQFTCECGSIFQKCKISRHLKSIKHQTFAKDSSAENNI